MDHGSTEIDGATASDGTWWQLGEERLVVCVVGVAVLYLLSDAKEGKESKK